MKSTITFCLLLLCIFSKSQSLENKIYTNEAGEFVCFNKDTVKFKVETYGTFNSIWVGKALYTKEVSSGKIYLNQSLSFDEETIKLSMKESVDSIVKLIVFRSNGKIDCGAKVSIIEDVNLEHVRDTLSKCYKRKKNVEKLIAEYYQGDDPIILNQETMRRIRHKKIKIKVQSFLQEGEVICDLENYKTYELTFLTSQSFSILKKVNKKSPYFRILNGNRIMVMDEYPTILYQVNGTELFRCKVFN